MSVARRSDYIRRKYNSLLLKHRTLKEFNSNLWAIDALLELLAGIHAAVLNKIDNLIFHFEFVLIILFHSQTPLLEIWFYVSGFCFFIPQIREISIFFHWKNWMRNVVNVLPVARSFYSQDLNFEYQTSVLMYKNIMRHEVRGGKVWREKIETDKLRKRGREFDLQMVPGGGLLLE